MSNKPVIKQVAVADLIHLEGNPRVGDVSAIADSYVRFGQVKPIVANKNNEVLAGNHQLAAARELGWEFIDVVYVDMEPSEAKAFSLADNRTAQLGTYDPTLLLEMLTEIDLQGTGYKETDVEDLMRALTPPDLDALAGEIGEPEEVFDEHPLTLTVKRATITRWKSAFVDPSLTDDEKLNRLLDQVT